MPISELADSQPTLFTYALTVVFAGSGEGQFSNYFRVAVDDSGNVYVADILYNRIQKFSASQQITGGSMVGDMGIY